MKMDFELPKGFTVDEPKDFPLPPGFTIDEPNKLQRFLKNVTPEGPISGIIGLARTAGQAAQGQRPDLMTNPENAIPEAFQGAAAGTGARAIPGRGGIEAAAKALTPIAKERIPGAYSDTQAGEPLRLPDLRTPAEKLGQARQDTKVVAQDMRNSGKMPAEGTGPPIEMPGAVTPQPTPLLPPQLVREFGAVRKGVELKDRLNPESASNLSAKQQALEAAIRPHLREIEAVGKRTSAPMAALEAAIPSLSEAVSTPGKAASVANWVRVYERAARAKFSEQAKASLGLATKNLNNNLGTDIALDDILKGP